MRLKQLRKGRGLKQREVAEAINCSQAVYSRYENGEREVATDTLNALADFYCVSTDYLLGRTDIPNIYETLAEMHIVPDADSVAIKKGPPGQEAGEPVKVVERVIPAGAKMPATPEELAEFVRAVMAEGSEDQRTT